MTTFKTTQDSILDAANAKRETPCLHCYEEQRVDGTVYCADCLAMHRREYQRQQDHDLHIQIASMDFVPAMIALGYIEDGSVIDAFWKGLLTEQEVAHIEEDMHWHFDTTKVRAVLAAKEVAA